MSSMDNVARSTGRSSVEKGDEKKVVLPNIPEDSNYNLKRYEAEQPSYLMNVRSDDKTASQQGVPATRECFTKLHEAGLHEQEGCSISNYNYPREIQYPPPNKSVTPPTTDGEHRLPKA